MEIVEDIKQLMYTLKSVHPWSMDCNLRHEILYIVTNTLDSRRQTERQTVVSARIDALLQWNLVLQIILN